MSEQLDCVVIGYNETPFAEYEALLRGYGADSEAYRDLRFSFVNLNGQKLNYIGLLNHVLKLARPNGGAVNGKDELKSCDIPNLAAVYLTHYLRMRGYQARYINLFQFEKDALAEYLESDPLCVAITTTFYLLNLPVNEMVKFIRERNSRTKIVVGGPLIANHLRNYREEELTVALEDIGADIYVNESQGEHTLTHIIDALKNGRDLSGVPNIIYREDGKLRSMPKQAEVNSLDKNFINWRTFADEHLGPTVQTRTARSCAFSCSFCNYPERAGKLTLASLETIEKELDSLKRLGYVKNLVFIDDTFNVPLPRFKEICRLMIEKDYQFNWFSYFRCSNSDEEAIELLARSGCKGVFLGIESGSPTILKNMNKAATIEKYERGMDLLRQYGVLTFASFIMGFPGETEETFRESVDFIKATKPDYYRAQLWYCEPGTPVDHQREKYKIEGEGFVWSHATMESMEAMDYIDQAFLEIRESTWLPQWSFDFWTIPSLLGKGYSLDQFKKLMTWSHRLLALEIASVSEAEKKSKQQEYLLKMVDAMP
ncbi:MAG TPA: PhpK family radical SAM P-methyltransferase [Pyrinomonadaceae bacterium]|nr:PhpK family radical SAM P-methyltransferase [Pyrinomonadaceae bacterium]